MKGEGETERDICRGPGETESGKNKQRRAISGSVSQYPGGV